MLSFLIEKKNMDTEEEDIFVAICQNLINMANALTEHLPAIYQPQIVPFL